jgi:hypothetical protein
MDAGNPYWKGSISTIDLPALNSPDQLCLIMQIYIFLFSQKTILTRRSIVLSFPFWWGFHGWSADMDTYATKRGYSWEVWGAGVRVRRGWGEQLNVHLPKHLKWCLEILFPTQTLIDIVRHSKMLWRRDYGQNGPWPNNGSASLTLVQLRLDCWPGADVIKKFPSVIYVFS